MEGKITELQRSAMHVSGIFDTFKEEITVLKMENNRLRLRLDETKEELNILQQYARMNNLEISGITEKDGEDADDLVVKVASAVGVHITHNDIDISHRLPHNRSTPLRQQQAPIILNFTRHTVRNKLYMSKKYLKGKTSHDIGTSGNTKLFINENLTQQNKQMFK
ncbi:uncharacterized protein LOC144349907 [Saccoglossus kowalevskii]